MHEKLYCGYIYICLFENIEFQIFGPQSQKSGLSIFKIIVVSMDSLECRDTKIIHSFSIMCSFESHQSIHIFFQYF